MGVSGGDIGLVVWALGAGVSDNDEPYVLQKNGMYYAHNSCGYVSRVLLAELFDKDYAVRYAKRSDEVRAIPVTDLLTGAEEVQEYIDRLEAMRDACKSQ